MPRKPLAAGRRPAREEGLRPIHGGRTGGAGEAARVVPRPSGVRRPQGGESPRAGFSIAADSTFEPIAPIPASPYP